MTTYSSSPRCAIKVDLKKTFDSVSFLLLIGFLNQFIHWIRVCVTSPSCTVSINGEYHGYFKGEQGLRQGDPLSPFLFVFIMQVFKNGLDQFCLLARISINNSKSHILFSGVSPSLEDNILAVLGVEKGTLILISTRLKPVDCKILIEKVTNRIRNWTNRFLSFAGRVQLIKSVHTLQHAHILGIQIHPSSI
ncbi:uncharacterized protein LOC132277764 [Cornus florida]|uniref:uncharacterized protein LOC132277764 n=1 Tax=Cornus florida TaxID=4283 RepID=UPI00289ED797|nr:uncharacterized protein LOC132277764 [Cornus florida]